MTNIVALAPGASLVRAFESVPEHHVKIVDRDQVNHLTRPENLDVLLRQYAMGLPEIVVLGDDVPIGKALSIARMLDIAMPQIELLLVAEADTELVLRSMRVGIREILAPSIGGDELKVLLHRASSNVNKRHARYPTDDAMFTVERSRVIVVVSAKGGVGKSTVAVNTAVGLAQVAPMETVLVDLDIQFGDVATLLDLKPTHSIADAFRTTAVRDTLILRTFLSVHPAGLYVLAGAGSPTVGDRVNASHVKRLLKHLSSQFRYVVVDTGAGLDEHTLAALEEANDVVIVTNMDVASIRAVRKEVDVLAELDLLPASRQLVLNMADRQSGLTTQDVEAVVGMPVSVVLPRSTDVPLAGNLGQPFMLAKKPGAVAKAMKHLLGLLSDDETEPEKTKAWRGMRPRQREEKRENNPENNPENKRERRERRARHL